MGRKARRKYLNRTSRENGNIRIPIKYPSQCLVSGIPALGLSHAKGTELFFSMSQSPDSYTFNSVYGREEPKDPLRHCQHHLQHRNLYKTSTFKIIFQLKGSINRKKISTLLCVPGAMMRHVEALLHAH